ncbi:MAG TPA: PilZ domain-containing protein [Terriglobales bacterium]|nr:PilZ domain-containing protein [Terriglobales bacterium]
MKTDLTPAASTSVHEHRHHPRYRWIMPVKVHISNSSAVRGISIELSESGMSALMSEALKVGELVKIEPIAGSKVSAIVRRQNGKICGFEFLNLHWGQVQQLIELSRVLPLHDPKSLNI